MTGFVDLTTFNIQTGDFGAIIGCTPNGIINALKTQSNKLKFRPYGMDLILLLSDETLPINKNTLDLYIAEWLNLYGYSVVTIESVLLPSGKLEMVIVAVEEETKNTLANQNIIRGII